jgi:hypothetical protein
MVRYAGTVPHVFSSTATAVTGRSTSRRFWILS